MKRHKYLNTNKIYYTILGRMTLILFNIMCLIKMVKEGLPSYPFGAEIEYIYVKGGKIYLPNK